MAAWHRELRIDTKGDGEVVDLNDLARTAVADAGIATGILCVHAPHTTAGVTALEYEPGANEDLAAVLERLVPRDDRYAHNVADSNGHAHARAAILGPSVTIPVSGGRLVLGTWQHVALVDFDDRPRTRTVLLTIVG